MFGPMSVASSRGSPCTSAGRALGEAGGELLGDRLLDQQPGARQAHLPGVVVLADRVADRQVQVGVREHQQRGLAAQFQRHRGQLRARGRGDQAAGRGRAGERDPRQVRVRRQRRAGLLAQALDDVEDTVGQPGLAGDVGQQAGGQRRPLRRLGHHRVPGRERGRDPPGRQHERGVPRRDHRGDPGGRPGDLLPVAGDLQAAAVQLTEPVGEEAEVVRDPRHHAAAVGAQQRSVVAGLHLRQILDPPLDAVGDRVQDGGPVRWRGPRPAIERLARRPHRGRHLGLAAPGDLRQRLPVDGGQVGERARRRHPAPADPVPRVDGHAGHVRFAHRHPVFTQSVPPVATHAVRRACRPPPPVPLAAAHAVRRPAAPQPGPPGSARAIAGQPARQVRLAPNFMNCLDAGQGRCRRPS